jgi:hypothetical protein
MVEVDRTSEIADREDRDNQVDDSVGHIKP